MATQLEFPPTGAYAPSESFEAAASIAGCVADIRERVFLFIEARGRLGATCDEVEQWLGMLHQTASARVYELHGGDGRYPERIRNIWCVGKKFTRKTRRNRSAAVYVVLESTSMAA